MTTATSGGSRTYRIQLPAPHAGQRAVLAALADDGGRFRFGWLDAGRRWFKTTLDMLFLVPAALAGHQCLWGAPTYDQVRIGFEYCRYACREHPYVQFNQTRMEATFPGGGVIRWRSLDNPDNARGHTASRIVVDEAGDCPEAGWYEVLRPMLMTNGGRALINGTPKGRNWFWRELVKAKAGESPDAIAWEVPTVGARIDEGQLIRAPHPMENPLIPWSEIEAMYATLPERTFRQEVLGEWLDDAGGVFHNVRGCLVPGMRLLDAPEKRRVARLAMGLDLAKHADYTVALIVDLTNRRMLHMARWNQESWPLTKARIHLLAREWDDPVIWMDATGVGDPIYDDLARAGLRVEPYKFTLPSKAALIENAVLVVEQQRIAIPECEGTRVLVSELEAYEYTRTPSGNLKMGAPEGMHDDCVIAFALAVWPLAGEAQGIPQTVIEHLAPGAFASMTAGWKRDAGAFGGMVSGGSGGTNGTSGRRL